MYKYLYLMYLKRPYKSILSVGKVYKTMIYNGDNKQIKIEFKKLLIDEGLTAVTVADRLKISDNQLNNTFNKVNLSFNDIYKMLEVIGYKMQIEFIKE